MGPEEEKAWELIDKFYKLVEFNIDKLIQRNKAIQCALVCIEEVKDSAKGTEHYPQAIEYYEKIKEKLIKLKTK